MFVFMVTGEYSENAGQTHRRVIIVGVDDSAEAEAAAKWAVREAELRTDDLLLIHAYRRRSCRTRPKPSLSPRDGASVKRCSRG